VRREIIKKIKKTPETAETSKKCADVFGSRTIHAHSHLPHMSIQHRHTLIHSAEAVEQGITINSLEWLGSIYKHVEMLFTASDWMDYTSIQTSEGNTLSIHTVYTGRG